MGRKLIAEVQINNFFLTLHLVYKQMVRDGIFRRELCPLISPSSRVGVPTCYTLSKTGFQRRCRRKMPLMTYIPSLVLARNLRLVALIMAMFSDPLCLPPVSSITYSYLILRDRHVAQDENPIQEYISAFGETLLVVHI